MAGDLQHKLLIAVYATLAMIVVSLSQTYSLTQQYLGDLVGADPSDYGTGNTFSNKGFLLHIIVFFLLILLPMFWE